MEKLINKVLCDSWENVLPKIKSKSVDLLCTDPPYGMNYRSNMRKEKHLKIENDSNLDWLDSWLFEIKRVMKEDSHIYIYCSWHNIDVFKQKIEKLFKLKNILIWDKKGFGMGDLFGDYAPSYEMILFCNNSNKELNNGRDSNILRTARTTNENHPTEKPVNLIKYLIEKSTKEGDLVLDTFAGSFTTAKACIESNRNYICCEIEKTYCSNAEKLIKNYNKSLF